MVGEERLELSQYCYHWILSPTRLPVPPFAHFCFDTNVNANFMLPCYKRLNKKYFYLYDLIMYS